MVFERERERGWRGEGRERGREQEGKQRGRWGKRERGRERDKKIKEGKEGEGKKERIRK